MFFLKIIRELAITYQAFEHYAFAHINSLGLTPSQFDVLATLGNQAPMTCKELGVKSLITKGTMTGVLQRLEEKGLVERYENPYDKRSMKIGLSEAGKALFESIFPIHVTHLEKAFESVSEKEMEGMMEVLKKIQQQFQR